MTISESDIKRLEELARIELDPGERELLGMQLERIIEFVRILGDAPGPAAGLEERRAAMSRPAAAPRGDSPGECLDRDEVLAAAPEREDDFFAVPPVLDADGS
ncbi:MAG: Asp-tRNA(Asn)/Glu-tRNA(Gln) amidotransferase subunit GatC [Candidatus Krumholzibacteria bacterium]|nr:Asp-tRNA(Asn)/Glu-tRNA(Gln) amidotransferase subunit GatC [Candidatus Krumholzibacteria bacterium]